MARSQNFYIGVGAAAGIVVVALFLLALGFPSDSGGPVALRASTITVGLSTFDVIEKRPQVMEDLGISIEVTRFQVPPQSIDALLKGETQLTVIPVELAGSVMLRDAGVYIIALDNMMNQAILTRPDSGLEEPGDLRGKMVAAVVGSGTFALFRSFMKTLYDINVDPEGPSDVTIVSVRPGDTLAALERGDVDAAVIWDPVVSLAVSERGMRILADYQALWERVNPGMPAPMLVWIASEEVVRDKEVLRKVLEAHRRAAEYWNNNKDDIVRMLSELYNLPPKVAETVWERNQMYTGACITPELKDAMVKVWQLAVKGGYLEEMPPPNNIITCNDLQE